MTEGEKIKRMPIKEFRELGYLQEINRRFLHPLGLAIEICVDDDSGEETVGCIWDYRDDPDGISFGLGDPVFSNEERDFEASVKAMRIAIQENKRRPARENALGFWIEPIPLKGD